MRCSSQGKAHGVVDCPVRAASSLAKVNVILLKCKQKVADCRLSALEKYVKPFDVTASMCAVYDRIAISENVKEFYVRFYG